MHLGNAREIKAELRLEANRLRRERPAARLPGERVAVGVCVTGNGTYGVAVRELGRSDLSRAVADRGTELAGDECDVRDVGVVRALQWEPADLQERVRPLRPGLSVAHVDVTAGTLGAFVAPVDGDGTAVHVLSNNHVLADSDQGATGDVVMQPGPADDGSESADRIGTLAQAVQLDLSGPNVVDAATAVLDEGIDVDTAYPAGMLTGWADVRDDISVEKAGRTTGLTRGRVSAIELDDVSVEYPVGVVDFENQIEIEGSAGVSFSAGGDSGSVVYRAETLEAVGLLFAGSETGGDGGLGLTYCNPVGVVLNQLGMRMLG